jgi:hypothetical protein
VQQPVAVQAHHIGAAAMIIDHVTKPGKNYGQRRCHGQARQAAASVTTNLIASS